MTPRPVKLPTMCCNRHDCNKSPPRPNWSCDARGRGKAAIFWVNRPAPTLPSLLKIELLLSHACFGKIMAGVGAGPFFALLESPGLVHKSLQPRLGGSLLLTVVGNA